MSDEFYEEVPATDRDDGATSAQPGIRPMRWWDIAQVVAIDQDVFGPTAWPVESFWGELAREDRYYVVVDDPPVAYAGLWLSPPDADVQTIAVCAAARGRGLGRRLLAHLADHARGQGCRRLHLEVKAGNPAVGLYESFGFRTVRLRPRYYSDLTDAIVMEAAL